MARLLRAPSWFTLHGKPFQILALRRPWLMLLSAEDTWPEGARCCVCLTFDLDAEYVFMGNDPSVAEKTRMLGLVFLAR